MSWLATDDGSEESVLCVNQETKQTNVWHFLLNQVRSASRQSAGRGRWWRNSKGRARHKCARERSVKQLCVFLAGASRGLLYLISQKYPGLRRLPV